MPVELSNADARALAIAAQGLAGRRHRDPLRLLDQLGAIQIDTISVIARSHELVAHARLGPISRSDLTHAFWERGRAFEYWAHAACLLPIDDFPLFAWRRRRNTRRYPERTAEQREVLARLDAGPLTTAELGGARTTPGWWEWSPLKRAVEQLLARGEVVCTERRGFRRIYALAEWALPADLLAADPDDDACHAGLVGRAAARLGVATADDLADYFRLPVAAVRRAAETAGLVPAVVEGWNRPAWADPVALGGASRRPAHRPVLLSPFDSLIWYRPRTERLFDFRHRLEAYTPAARREHGYFVMPLLSRGRLVGRVDPRRDGRVLSAVTVSFEERHLDGMAEALLAAARWVGCEEVAVGNVSPSHLGPPLRAALASRN
jgi:uncharacterized protein YcaQ